MAEASFQKGICRRAPLLPAYSSKLVLGENTRRAGEGATHCKTEGAGSTDRRGRVPLRESGGGPISAGHAHRHNALGAEFGRVTLCWERERQRISADPATQTAFLALLACVVSRGGHAAIALRDRVVNSAAA